MEFSRSKYYKRLTPGQKRESEVVVMGFTEYMYTYHDLSPEEWDEEGLEECCLETLPRKITAEESYYKSIAPVLSAFFTFTEDRGLLENSLNLARRVMEIDEQIVKNATDPRNWGPAKSLLLAATTAGVDMQDEKELNEFIMSYNLQQAQGRLRGDTRRKTKIGRNEPCPCGSGRKYKKCCGSII